MWGRLPTELIHHIVDLLVKDSGARSLFQLSLVNKAFAAYARHCIFQDLSINICRDPYIAAYKCHTKRCIKQLALLLKGRVPASIPRKIRTLTINGRDIGGLVQYFSLWNLVGNPGAMDDENVTVPVWQHFKEVEELRLIEVDLFPLSFWASFRRPLIPLLSSVRTLVLDEAKFYGGPDSFHSFIFEIPNLERLCLKGVTWPSEIGFPDNPPTVIVLVMNFSCHFPETCELLFRLWCWSRKVKETLFPQRFGPISSSTNHLTLDFRHASAAAPWVMKQPEMLSKLSSLEIYSSCLLADGSQEVLKRFLASASNIVHLTFRWCAASRVSFNALFQPDLSLCTSLRTLHLQAVCEWQTSSWLTCRTWLHSMTCSIRDLPLTHVQVTMDLDIEVASFEHIDTDTLAADEYLCREGLTVEVCVGVFDELKLHQPPHTADELMDKGWRSVRNAFSLCQGRPSFIALVKAGRWL